MRNENLSLRKPEESDLDALNALILRSKAVHGYDEDFMAACRTELRVTRQDLKRGSIILGERAGGIAGMAQVGAELGGCYLEKLFVEPACMGTGIGSVLFRWAADAARSGGAAEMLIEADPGAVPFYVRMGAVVVGRAPSGSIPGRTLPLLVMQL